MQIMYKIIGWSLGALLIVFSLISLRQGLWPFLLLMASAVLMIPFFEQYRKKIRLTMYPALFIGSVMGVIGINGIKFEELEEAGNKIGNAQIEHAEPAKELGIPEISNTEPEANDFSDAEIAAAMAAILRDARARKRQCSRHPGKPIPRALGRWWRKSRMTARNETASPNTYVLGYVLQIFRAPVSQ